MNLSELKKYALKMANENPTLKEEIWDFVQLAIDEIEEGGSMQHECSLAQRDIEELINTMKVEESNSTGGDKTVNGYTNLETYTMISHIHNDRDVLETAFSNIRTKNSPLELSNFFRYDTFERGTLANIFGLIAFNRINWVEIFDNLKEMMPKGEKFTIGDYLMIVDGDGLTFDWKGRIFQHDCTYTEAFNRDEEICVWDCENDNIYNVNQNRFVKVNHEWRFVQESDRWISEWRDENDNDVVAVNYFQGDDLNPHYDLKKEFFLPNLELTEKVLAKKMNVDDAIWSVIHEEDISKEELLERLALANGQAKFLFDLLRKSADGDDDYLADELFYSHNIKVITDITNDEYKFDK
jgi:hypothetical protein